jgi:hypothetical protein
VKELLFPKRQPQPENSGDIVVYHRANLDKPQKSPDAFSV